MGTFTVATGFGMLALGVAVTMSIAITGFVIIRSQAKKKVETENKSDIEKQIEGLRR